MEESTELQNNKFKQALVNIHIDALFKKIFILMIFFIALLAGVAYAYDLGKSDGFLEYRNREETAQRVAQKKAATPQPVMTPVLSPEPSPETIIQQQATSPDGKQFTATYEQFIDEITPNGLELYAVTLRENAAQDTAVYSWVSRFYGDNPPNHNYFYYFNNLLYVVNGYHNAVDVYAIKVIPMPEGTVDHAKGIMKINDFVYQKSIVLPPLALGTLYALKCADEQCELRSAHHMESGCDTPLNLQTETFGKSTCGNNGGSFEPEAL